jgi:hypothetical protein
MRARRTTQHQSPASQPAHAVSTQNKTLLITSLASLLACLHVHPQIAKHVQAWQPPTDTPAHNSKSVLLRPLALQLFSRRPLLFLRGQPEPLPASVLLRTTRKPSLATISRGVGTSASLFRAPDNSLVVIKFDPRFGFAGGCCHSLRQLQRQSLWSQCAVQHSRLASVHMLQSRSAGS